MNKIDILIIEDNIEEARILENTLTASNFNVVGKITNLEDGLEFIKSKSFDLIIIDIHLNGKPDGFTIAREVNNKFQMQKPFLFLTGSSERNDFNSAKILGPFGYLLKPFNELELIYAIELTIDKYTNQQYKSEKVNTQNCFPLLIKKKGAFFKVEEKDILHIEVEGRYCSIITLETNFLVKHSLEDFTNLLPKNSFIRTHRKYIINRNAIKQIYINDNLIILEGDKSVSLGRAYKNDFINFYNIIK